ncbi:MAG: hypothetical protein NZ870_02780 [bacterium]|nr:hypothetical protein [bacterium]
MDTLSHGLWGAIAFGRKNKKNFIAAFTLGVAPDIISFGPFFVEWALKEFPKIHRKLGEPPDPSMIPEYVYQLYNITHSLIVFGLLALILKIFIKDIKPFFAWALHILCDIPTHTKKFFPTPYLWPFETPYFDGIRWGPIWFIAINYTLLFITYYLTYKKKK